MEAKPAEGGDAPPPEAGETPPLDAGGEAAAEARRLPDFLLLEGGPYHTLRRQLEGLSQRAARAPSRALLLAAICWGVPLLLSLIAGRAWGEISERPFLLDPVPWARFLLLVVVFTLAERAADARLNDLIGRFGDAPLIARSDMPRAVEALTHALRRRDAWFGEAVCLVLAICLSLHAIFGVEPPAGGAWYARSAAEGGGATAAGIWAGLVSTTIFAFLMLRWLWALVIWGLLLRDLSGLRLRLSLFHPDGYGGLGFIGRYPNVFSLHVLAISCVMGAALMRQVMSGTLQGTVYATVMGVWLGVVLVLFGLPLLAFTPVLSRYRKDAMEAAAAQATNHGRESERAVLGANMAAPADPAEPSDVSDPGKLYAAAKKMSTLPFTRDALLPICAAALLPLVAAGATELPLKEIVQVAKKLLLL